MIALDGDLSLYMKESGAHTTRPLGAHVDGCLLAGDESFQRLTKQMLKKFESRDREWDDVEFLGVRITTIPGLQWTFQAFQPEYFENLNMIPLDIDFESFRSIRAMGGCVVRISFVISMGMHKLRGTFSQQSRSRN